MPTTGVGSFPKPEYVVGAKGRLDENSKKATREFIKRQEDLGIDVLVDGEFYRGDMATDYYRALGLPIADWTRSYNNRYWKKGIVDKPLKRKTPIQLEQFVFAQSLTKKPVKAILTGPTTLSNWGFKNYFQKREDLVLSWANVVREEIQDLVRAGAKYVQIDEPAAAERYFEKDLLLEALKKVTQGISAYTITHICYSNLLPLCSIMPELPVDQIDIELSSELDLGPEGSTLLRMMKEDPLTNHKDVAVGVIDVRPGVAVETRKMVTDRINTALGVLVQNDQLSRVWIHPDCGFRTTKNIEVAYKKMKVMVDATREIRDAL